MAEAQEAASSGLFGVFLLSIYSLFLIPYTIYHLCSAGEESTTQPVARGKKTAGFADRLKAWCTKGNLMLLALWVMWFAVLFYTQSSMASMKPFDPFEILGVPREASGQDIKKAYRKLSLLYHPDKNPDPKAAQYFASHVSKAYAALTDEVSRQNYEKYGHPDGPQGINLGVALPDWMFAKDKKAAPLMLLGLVGCGILLPLGIMSWYMLSSSKFTGPNQIMNDTFQIFIYSKYSIKESQSLGRIPETLLCAMEFITLYTPPEHTAPMDELRRMVAPSYSELMSKTNKTFWQRKAGVVKAHMLLLAHLERMGADVPAALQSDLRYVLAKSPLLLEEMIKIATLPRTQAGTGWMTPALACVEMCQCIAQALPVSLRRGGGKAGDSLAPLLQLPGFNQEIIKKLRKRKINTVADLQAMPETQRSMELNWAGLDAAAVEGVQMFLSAMPTLVMAAKCEVDGEDEIMESDPVHCRVRVLLSRPSHKQEGFSLRGSAVRAYTPYNPTPRDESWYFFLTEPSNNAVLAWTKVNLMEAERQGLAHPEAFQQPSSNGTTANGNVNTAATIGSSSVALALLTGSSDNSSSKALVKAAEDNSSSKQTDKDSSRNSSDKDPVGQEIDLLFPAPKAATYTLNVVAMSDCWIGADESVPLKLRVAPLTRAVAEVRVITKKPAFSDSEDEGDSGSEGSSSGGESDDDYDSEETGEEESGDEGSDAGSTDKDD